MKTHMKTEILQDLLEYCQLNARVCPQPQRWDYLWKMLPNHERNGNGWNPPAPLILAAWWETSDVEKRNRLKEHLMYANMKGILEVVNKFLRDLPKDQWYHEYD